MPRLAANSPFKRPAGNEVPSLLRSRSSIRRRRSRRRRPTLIHDAGFIERSSFGARNSYTPVVPFAAARWVRGVAWSILGGSGPLDSGSNPDGPIASFQKRSDRNVVLRGGNPFLDAVPIAPSGR